MPTFNLPSYGMSRQEALQLHYSVVHLANVNTTQGVLYFKSIFFSFAHDCMIVRWATNMQVKHDVTATCYRTSCVKNEEGEPERKKKTLALFSPLHTGQSTHEEGLNVRLSVLDGYRKGQTQPPNCDVRKVWREGFF